MSRKKIQIPYYTANDEKDSISELRIKNDLKKMHDIVNNSSLKQSSQSIQDMKQSQVIIKKKRMKNSNKQINFQNTFLNMSKLGLRKVLEQQKVKSISKNFLVKIQRNITNSKPVQFYPYLSSSTENILNRSGFLIPNWFDLTFAFSSIIQIMILCFVYTLSLVFDQFIDSSLIETLQTFSMCFYAIQIVINFLSIKTIDGRKIVTLRQIFRNYIKKKFLVDLLCLAILTVDINTKFIVTKYIRLCVVLKIRQCLEKMQKIQNFFINNFYREQYWSLTKVFLVNFVFAHFLAVILLAMCNLDQNDNWIIKIQRSTAPWYELYSWAFYWGTTIMLTVGFGDLSASNYKQAICLTIIQTFSCVLLAYNINCVGNLISNIRYQDAEKTKSFKIMRKLAQKNKINDQLEWKVCNFISESDKMKKQFGFQDEKKFISNLPSQLKAQFLKQSNIKIFATINFFKTFSEKTLLTLAEMIQMRIAHPQQIIFRGLQNFHLMVLKQGKLGYCTKLQGSDYSGTVVNVLKITDGQNPQLIHLTFLNQSTRNPKYKIKSLNYSLVFHTKIDDFISVIKSNKCDFENYCFLKDKSKHIVDQFQIIHCQNCKSKHTKMSCPKLHYIPFYQVIVFRHLQNVKISKNDRLGFNRKRNRSHIASSNPFKLLPYFIKLQQSIYKNRRTITETRKQQSKSAYQSKRQASTKKSFNFVQDKNTQSFTRQILINQLMEVISASKKAQITGQFKWDIQCDISHNFKLYFPDSNPSELYAKAMDRKLKRRSYVYTQNSRSILAKVIKEGIDFFD